ncbi:MAG: HDOD domain-containing protein [Thermoguttaceae bacterium]
MTNTTAPNLELKKLLSTSQLPALPQSAIRLLELSRDPNNGPSEFAVPIEVDPGLTGQVLRFVNSSYFGFSREISSVKMAISLVGVRTIKNFALWSAVFSLTPNPKCGPFELNSLWQDSLRRALFARSMAKILGIKDPEDVFAVALLQDMAVPILAKEASQIYAKLLESRNGGQVRLSYLEKQLFGWCHAEAAGYMAEHWNLPEVFSELLRSHTKIDELASGAHKEPGKLSVAFSALLPSVADPNWVECRPFETFYEQMTPDDKPTIADLLAKIDREFADFAPVMRLPAPEKTLVDFFQEATAMTL